ncbi:hypothetical protein J4449_01200 [Candidatus Woesearchaeota archaeon]|nr:hypothetical protein [Candidatus Woesearchaeota archaeon]
MEKADIIRLKKDINLLRSNLNNINTTKRKKLKEIHEIKSEIRSNLNKVKEFKNKKSLFLNELEELKKQRDFHNKNVHEHISSLKNLNEGKKEIEKKFKIKYNPLAIKEKIDQLETKIQTDVISFDKEKKIMGEIKKLKADFKNSGSLFAIKEKEEKISKNIKEEREKADLFHNNIREILNSNREENKEFKDLFRQLDKLRKVQEEKQKELDEINKNFELIANDLNLKLIEIGKINPSLIENNKKEERKRRDEKILEEKSRLVEEKLKNKGKLTTEDLIIMQGKLKDE